jgi:hypothetical protein
MRCLSIAEVKGSTLHALYLNMMSSTVVKKDTASRDIIHGSSRAEINTETIMMCSTVVKMFNLEPNMVSSTVVKKDTASHDLCHGSSRAEIIMETIMMRSTVVYKNKLATSSEIVCIKQHNGFLQNYVIMTREDKSLSNSIFLLTIGLLWLTILHSIQNCYELADLELKQWCPNQVPYNAENKSVIRMHRTEPNNLFEALLAKQNLYI